jgi:hypothetical protein
VRNLVAGWNLLAIDHRVRRRKFFALTGTGLHDSFKTLKSLDDKAITDAKLR